MCPHIVVFFCTDAIGSKRGGYDPSHSTVHTLRTPSPSPTTRIRHTTTTHRQEQLRAQRCACRFLILFCTDATGSKRGGHDPSPSIVHTLRIYLPPTTSKRPTTAKFDNVTRQRCGGGPGRSQNRTGQREEWAYMVRHFSNVFETARWDNRPAVVSDKFLRRRVGPTTPPSYLVVFRDGEVA